MKVLLIATNQANRYMGRMVVRPLPVGLAYLAAYVDEGRHELSLLDLMFSRDGPADVDAAVRSFQPDVVGLSVRNLDNQSYIDATWHLPAVRDIVRRIRSVGNATVVCGGPAFSILPALCLEYTEADMGIVGDGGEAFETLLDHLEAGQDPDGVPGLVYRDSGRIVVRDGTFAQGFPRPPRLDLLDMRRYDKSGFGVGVVTKLAPAYYTTEGSAGEDWRIRPVNEVVEEMRRLGDDFGITKLFFIDSGFNIPLSAGKELCGSLMEADLGVRWNSYLRPGECDTELVRLMRDSGCSLALFAGSDDQGKNLAMDLSARLQRVGYIGGLCREVALPFALSLTFGEPGESEVTVREKLDLLEEVGPSFATLRVGTRVLPNTGIAEAAREEMLIESEADLLRPIFYIAPEVRDWIVGHLREAVTSHPRWNIL